MIEITNQEIFGKVIADAMVSIDGNAQLQTWEKLRAVNAVASATAKMEEQGCFMDYDGDAGVLVIWSQKSNQVYTVTGGCQCEAAANGHICWHRAAKRLWENYLKAVAANAFTQPGLSSFNNLPYLKPASGKKVETMGGVRF